MHIAISPPRSEQELMSRATALAGQSLQTLADRVGVSVPENLQREKGWVGQLLEANLGADAGSKPVPDFTALGIELKTLPLNKNRVPKETTFVCVVDLLAVGSLRWKTSNVRKKLARVLWVPLEADNETPLANRLVGQPILWSPTSEQEATLKTDWEELTDMVALGQLEQITARHGDVLQIRPKGANAKSLTWGIGANGEKIKTLPRGFYLRTSFTSNITAQSLALGDS